MIDRLNGRVDEPLEDNDSALHLACLYGHLPCVQVSFATRTLDSSCIYVNNSLMYLLQLLLERGANIEVKDEDEAIPLHDACAGGKLGRPPL